MFQDFEVRSQRDQTPPRVAALRAAMAQAQVDAWLVPHADEQQNEYLPPCAERLAWLTAFTGSAGFAVVCAGRAVLFVDGRYTLQAAAQTDPSVFAIESLVETPPHDWLAANAREGWRIGYDPALLTIAGLDRFESAASKAGATLVPLSNLVDSVWTDRPAPPAGAVAIHDLSLAGKSAIDKLAELASGVAAAGAQACVLSDPASVAWAFNIRGSDVAHIPVPLAWAILRREGRPELFIDPAKLGRRVRAYLTQLADLHEPESLEVRLAEVAAHGAVICDPERVNAAVAATIGSAGGKIIRERDPVALPRAVKNEAEIAGTRAAHLRDGVAMVRFLAWLDGRRPGSVDEIDAAAKLEKIRAANARDMESRLEEISFDTISGAGANGAIVHYRVNSETNATLEAGSLYLIDSGAQYRDGTTDITRTVAIGEPPELARQDFTLVLKGHIAVATARFPSGSRGVDLDPLARADLWRAGRDYAHGTGHGVGAFLSVHEGPQSISRRGMEPLRAGMIVSNEPGFYRQGKWGIRIENLLLVRETAEVEGGSIAVHSFETLTLAPIDRRLVEVSLLTGAERQWLDTYHARVLAELSPVLPEAERKWLEQACAPL